MKMASNSDGEKSSLGKYVKSQTRYGTTSKIAVSSERFLKHSVKPNETLQGISLKYSVSMQQIKRANNIWTNDSLFLREFLLIPISSGTTIDSHQSSISNGSNSMGESDSSTSSTEQAEIVTRQDLSRTMSKSKSHPSMVGSAAGAGAQNHAVDNVPSVSANDFLSRFDTSLSQIRTKVNNLEHTSNFPEDTNNPLSMLPRRHSGYGYRHRRPGSIESSDSDIVSEPELMFKTSLSSNRQVKTSLERLQKDEENMYQL